LRSILPLRLVQLDRRLKVVCVAVRAPQMGRLRKKSIGMPKAKKKTPATAEQPAETAANETQPAEPPHSPSPQHKPSARDVVPESPGRMLRAAAVKDIKEKNKMVRQTA
jgi:hypothetical protein